MRVGSAMDMDMPTMDSSQSPRIDCVYLVAAGRKRRAAGSVPSSMKLSAVGLSERMKSMHILMVPFYPHCCDVASNPMSAVRTNVDHKHTNSVR